MRVITNSEQETISCGKKIGRRLKAGDILGLCGQLGSGKTTLVKGIACGLGVGKRESISSPSFVLIREYAGKIPLFHFDLYRLDKIKDIELLGVEEYIFDQGVCVIEWAEKMKLLLPEYLEVNLTIKGENKREIRFSAASKRYKTLLKAL